TADRRARRGDGGLAAAARGDQRPAARLRGRRARRAVNDKQIAHATIADPEHHTVMDRGGAVRSIQAANVDMRDDELEPLWEPMQLERLARTYWTYLSRVTLGMIRVIYTESERSVVFLARPFVLLRFTAPDYTFSPGRGIVRWNIQDGLLVG